MTKREILKTIKKHCVDCSGGSATEAKLCACKDSCNLWTLRTGKDPTKNTTRVETGRKHKAAQIAAQNKDSEPESEG